MSAERQVDEWPEREQREWVWLPPAKAVQMVEEGGLAEIIRGAFPLITRLESPLAKRRYLPR